jgi:predicted methyltransferase
MLDKVTALQPVHYFWRASEFPNRHFGNSQNYGLIAQDVEQVLPELVATDGDGYKAVDYSELPLLTIQAVKELKAENDALKARVAEIDPLKQRVAEIDPLKQRVTELERLLTELLAKQR